MNDKDYDNWRLSTPWDNEMDIETFKSEFGEFYSINESNLDCFEEELEKLKEKFGIKSSEDEAVMDHLEYERDRIEYEMDLWREARRDEI